ncbi:MAG: sigma-70 family RNA polymerase sigma factor [Bacteroidetes bacterium]|nr:sigma-70 family RNA polymerase sigma factor [Bacteroidota bacterium]
MTDYSDRYNQESVLWIQFREGEKNALGSLFELYYDDLYAYGMKLTGNEELVRDSIQDLFVKLWESRNRIKTVKQVKPYLIRAFRNLTIDQSRLAEKVPIQNVSISELPELLNFEPEDFKTEAEFAQDQISKLLNALNELPPRVREAVYLRYFTGLNYDELATVMNVTVQSARNLIHQGIKSLKEELLVLIVISKYGFLFQQ